MRTARHLPRRCLTAALVLTAVLAPGEAGGLEPVSALDDAFTTPSSSTMTEAVGAFPGAESLGAGLFATAAWTRPFGVDDLAVSTFVAGARRGPWGVSLSYSGSGFELYGDETEKIGLSRAFRERCSIGVRLTRTAMRISGFGDADAWSGDIGVVAVPVKGLTVAVAVEDIAGAELGDSREPLDGRSRACAAWKAAGGITLLASASKVRRFRVGYSGGFLAEVASPLSVGAAAGTQPDRLDLLATVNVRSFVCSYRGSWHRELGMTHGFSLSRGIARVKAPDR